MKRRSFISLLGGAASWPIGVRAQQPAMPVIGFLHPAPSLDTDRVLGFRQGLKETGFVEGENVAIEYRWAGNQNDRLLALAAELIRRRVAVIATAAAGIFAAKAATATVPIVFVVADDPVKAGLVASLARPGGNLTGINFYAAELFAKRLELLRQLVPGAARVALLADPAEPSAESILDDVMSAARSMGLQVRVFNAGTSSEIDVAFATIGRERPDGILVGISPFFTSRRLQLAHWATRVAIPAIFSGSLYAEAGGLLSYGASLKEAWRQVGIYTGRILKGAKPADLPVVQSSKFELVINQQTARVLGLTVPPTLLALADEVIE